MKTKTQHKAPREKTFYLYPVITVIAETEEDATDRVLDAIFDSGRGIGEIPGWLPPPPSHEEKMLHRAAPALLAAAKRAEPLLRRGQGNNIFREAADALAAAIEAAQ